MHVRHFAAVCWRRWLSAGGVMSTAAKRAGVRAYFAIDDGSFMKYGDEVVEFLRRVYGSPGLVEQV